MEPRKPKVVDAILDTLRRKYKSLKHASEQTRGGGTDTESKAEGKYDTRSTEANYLADGQAMKAELVAQAIAAFEALEAPEEIDAAISIGSLFQLEFGRERVWFFLGPAYGGLEIDCDGLPITVISPDSPVGSGAIGLRANDEMDSPPARVVKVL